MTLLDGPEAGATEVRVWTLEQRSRDALIPAQPEGYLAANHLWNAREKHVRLHSARGEFVAFQVVLQGHDCTPTLRFPDLDQGKPSIQFGRYRSVESKAGPLPDPIVALEDVPARLLSLVV